MIPEEGLSAEAKEKPAKDSRSPYSRERTARARFYWSLILFIVVAGVLLLAVPALRSRLVQRSRDLYGAIWGTRAPVEASVNDRQSTYPEEYEREAPVLPDAGQGIPEDWIFRMPSRSDAEGRDVTSSLISPPTRSPENVMPARKGEANALSEAGSGNEDPDQGVQYSTGKSENEAYTLLLGKYPKVAALVRGDDPSLRFLSWEGAEVQEGVFWVKLIFEAGGKQDVYIWEVNQQSGEVQPLSYNARTIS